MNSWKVWVSGFSATLAALYIVVLGFTFASPNEASADATVHITITGSAYGGGISFDPDGPAQQILEGDFPAGSVLTVYAIPDEGFSFGGFQIRSMRDEKTGKPQSAIIDMDSYTISVSQSEKIALKPVFTEIKSSYLVTITNGSGYSSETGMIVDYVIVAAGDRFTLPQCVFNAPPGWRFDQWWGDVGGYTNLYPGDVITVESDITFTASWVESIPAGKDYCTVTLLYYEEDGNARQSTQKVAKGESFVLPQCEIVREGQFFAGWDSGNPGDEITITDDVTVKAVWDSKPVSFETSQVQLRVIVPEGRMSQGAVVYDKSDYGDGSTFSVARGETVSLAPTLRAGTLYEVSSTDVDLKLVYKEGGTYAGYNSPVEFVMPAHDVEIVFRFVSPVSFAFLDGGGGEGIMQPLKSNTGTFVLPECDFLPPEGKMFKGWNRGAPGEKVELIQGEHAFVALWEDSSGKEHRHLLVLAESVPATCDASGTEAYWKCSECEKLFADAEGKEEISAPREIAALGHDWGEWKVTRQPTATTEGEKVRTCKRDPSHTETAAIPATGEKPEPYAVVDEGGTTLTWVPESDEGLTFTVKRTEGDDTTYEHFTGVTVDSVSVPPLGYTAREGSLILTLLPDYLESLGTGGHDIAIFFDDGTVSASFTISESGGETPGPGPGPAKRGLPTWAWILVGVAVVALSGSIARCVSRRKTS